MIIDGLGRGRWPDPAPTLSLGAGATHETTVGGSCVGALFARRDRHVVDLSALGTHVSPEHRETVLVHITMPCNEVLKEAAEGTANPFSVTSGRPPVLFSLGAQVNASASFDDDWWTPMVAPPDADQYVAYYVPDTAYCQSHPTESLEYDITFHVQPTWTVPAGATANVTFYSFLVGTDAWFYGPNPYAERSLVFTADPAARVVAEPARDAFLAAVGEQTDLEARVSVWTNFPADLSLQTTALQHPAVCSDGTPIIGSHLIKASPGQVVHVQPGPHPFVTPEPVTVSALATPPVAAPPTGQSCTAIQDLVFPILLMPNPPLPGFTRLPEVSASAEATWWYTVQASPDGTNQATAAGKTAPLQALVAIAAVALAVAVWRRSP